MSGYMNLKRDRKKEILILESVRIGFATQSYTAYKLETLHLMVF
jgi:hypothetical protein